ncbi:hypothetical protein SeMB42_g02334 [Synchytrium endobioticum]|uniref:Transcription initiation factor TFIID subunit 8 n=1 Tax=Synchytrium endobioticum TaxID=286115 RepID=A0A507DF49_9FUNG|nr:hypothetical protein SeLEV6574_g03124 [Synchytrium endobioticum]TPX50223.1 hypothetical protein SeMB42_g02334 [Synchytrium endobioticum]
MVSPYETQLLRAIIATQLRHVGFEESSSRAVDVLTDVLVAYLHRLGTRVKAYAEHATRIQPTPLDFMFVFDEFRVPITDLHSYAAIAKTAMKAIRPIKIKPDTIASNKEVYRYLNPPSSLVRVEDTTGSRGEHVPEHFPPFPSAHTYLSTPVSQRKEETDPIKKHEVHAQSARQVEEALVKLYRASLVATGREDDPVFSYESGNSTTMANTGNMTGLIMSAVGNGSGGRLL